MRLGTGHLWAHPFLALVLRVLGAIVESVDGPTSELLGPGGPWRCFLIRVSLSCDELRPVRRGKTFGEFCNTSGVSLA